jgi:hypothetical protein
MTALEWFTGLLAFATLWLAFATSRMAKATKQLVALSAEPYFSLAGVDLIHTPNDRVTGKTGYAVSLTLRNPGQVRILYDVSEMSVNLASIDYPPSGFANRGGVIHPGETFTFDSPFFECAAPMAAGLTGTVDFDAWFWAIECERKRVRFKVQLKLVDVSSDGRQGRIKWVYLSGPTYT